ncbi:MAG TPA: methyltransferase domain-containing protein [Candidatus Saccharibacteria bacterium]|nr:methyltransferase domain-containing protein [Candidatus Saccharibacteria bacterium]
MYISILGRQPALGIAELERLYGDVTWFSDESAIINTTTLDFERLGGSQKAGRIVAELPRGDWVQASRKLVAAYTKAWHSHEGKITLGISAYGFRESARDIQKTGIILKKKLRESNVSLRLIPNDTPALSTATSHHNKLGLSDNKVELLIVRGKSGKIIIAESVGAQNITAYARRDQGRPKRDAFVGMLPPKLAQIILNLANPAPGTRVLDPFCGTGVVLQEASLQGFKVYGTDLSDKMIDYSRQNLAWLAETHHIDIDSIIEQGDAMKHQWHETISAAACEGYLGQPFSAPPSPAKLAEVRKNCNHIMSEFLKNIASQLKSGASLCVAIPAWKAHDGSFTHLPLVEQLGTLGYKQVHFKTVNPRELLYHREDQVVARELLVIVKS